MSLGLNSGKLGRGIRTLLGVVVVGAVVAGCTTGPVSPTSSSPPPGTVDISDLIEEESYDPKGTFLMPVFDVSDVHEHGIEIVGKILRGKVRVGDQMEIVGLGGVQTTKIVNIDKGGESVKSAEAGQSVGIAVADVNRASLARGQVLAKPGVVVSQTRFEADIFIVEVENGGPETVPPDLALSYGFYDVFIEGTGSALDQPAGPGKRVRAAITLRQDMAMAEGTRFFIRDGEDVIGIGKVTKLLG